VSHAPNGATLCGIGAKQHELEHFGSVFHQPGAGASQARRRAVPLCVGRQRAPGPRTAGLSCNENNHHVRPTELDDGLLTASEVAQLKLNADWIVLSACTTACSKPGAEALSGLARAFFYAGGRSLLVSNLEVETKSAVDLMVATFAAIAADPKLSHGEALQKSMLAMIDNAHHSEWADPKFWAPFFVVRTGKANELTGRRRVWGLSASRSEGRIR
jgi:hypothetical protein